MNRFKATLEIIGVNPFVFVPEKILNKIFKDANRNKQPIPVCGTINGKSYKQTLVRYKGEWRLYINTTMVKDSPKKVGEVFDITIQFDPVDRTISPHPKLLTALNKNPTAYKTFNELPPSRQKEIIRYISNLKSEKSITYNIERAIGFLNGKNRFVGRDITPNP